MDKKEEAVNDQDGMIRRAMLIVIPPVDYNQLDRPLNLITDHQVRGSEWMFNVTRITRAVVNRRSTRIAQRFQGLVPPTNAAFRANLAAFDPAADLTKWYIGERDSKAPCEFLNDRTYQDLGAVISVWQHNVVPPLQFPPTHGNDRFWLLARHSGDKEDRTKSKLPRTPEELEKEVFCIYHTEKC